MNLKINNKIVKFKLDTGSQVNILTDKIYNTIQSEKSLVNTSVRLTSYSRDSIPVAEKCVLPYKDHQLEFYVTPGNQPPVLGYKSCCELGFIKVTLSTGISQCFSPVDKYSSVFSGLGCLKEPYRICTDDKIKSVIHNPRQIPTAFRDELKKTLDDMESKKSINLQIASILSSLQKRPKQGNFVCV